MRYAGRTDSGRRACKAPDNDDLHHRCIREEGTRPRRGHGGDTSRRSEESDAAHLGTGVASARTRKEAESARQCGRGGGGDDVSCPPQQQLPCRVPVFDDRFSVVRDRWSRFGGEQPAAPFSLSIVRYPSTRQRDGIHSNNPSPATNNERPMRNIFFAVSIGILAGCRLTAPLDDASIQVVDLTHPLDEKTIFWPTSPSTFQLERLAHGMTDAGFFYAANSFCMPEHGGTHLDAPIHFAEGGWTTDQIPVDRLVGAAAVIDVSAKAESNSDYRLTREDVLEWERLHGRIPSGAIVLLRTGWSRRWPDRKSYMGDDTPGDASHLHFPSFGEDAAGLLVNERNAHALGVDT